MPQGTPDQIVSGIQEFWKIFCSANPTSHADYYAPNTLIFGVEGARPEPARLGLARRQREYFEHHAQVKVELGPIEVQWIGEKLALAVYTFSFHASNVALAGSKGKERQIAHGRATQLFEVGEEGKLQILHEHFSSADIRKE